MALLGNSTEDTRRIGGFGRLSQKQRRADRQGLMRQCWREGAVNELSEFWAAYLAEIEEAAERLGIGRPLIYHLSLPAKFESVRVGLGRIPEEYLGEHIDRLRSEAPEIVGRVSAAR